MAKPEAILASNTSSISITKIGAFTPRPEKVVGMHFMNPVPIMQLVEIIPGLATSEHTLSTTLALAKYLCQPSARHTHDTHDVLTSALTFAPHHNQGHGQDHRPV